MLKTKNTYVNLFCMVKLIVYHSYTEKQRGKESEGYGRNDEKQKQTG